VVKFSPEADRFAQGARQQLFQLHSQCVGIDWPRFEHLLARKCQQAICQLRTPFGGGYGGRRGTARRSAVIPEFPLQELQITQNDRKYIVEVMGHPTTASIFWAWRYCASISFRSVSSRTEATAPIIAPLASFKGWPPARTCLAGWPGGAMTTS
jgi:hypothetical protein